MVRIGVPLVWWLVFEAVVVADVWAPADDFRDGGHAQMNERVGIARHYRLDHSGLLGMIRDSLPVPLPLHNGSVEYFKFVDTTHLSLHSELAAKFPTIRTFHGKANGFTAELDITHNGLHAQIFCISTGILYIDRLRFDGEAIYSVYSRKENIKFSIDSRKNAPFDDHHDHSDNDNDSDSDSEGVKLQDLTRSIFTPSSPLKRMFRLAVATDGEYAEFHGNKVETVLSAIITVVNRVNGIIKRALGVAFQLVAESEKLICLAPCSLVTAGNVLNVIGSYLDQEIGNDGYDLGHLFTAGVAGSKALLGGVCNPGLKSRATSGIANPIGDSFTVDYVMHEIAHQLGSPHSFNGLASYCSSNRNAASAYEPGAGSTIMSYAGICEGDNFSDLADSYFHVSSLEKMQRKLESNSANCALLIGEANSIPTAQVMNPVLRVPKKQPFVLVAQESVAPSVTDILTYCWEQVDNGSGANLANPTSTDSPRFRSREPSTSRMRYFPQFENVMTGSEQPEEQLPTESGVMHFAVTVRDHYNPRDDIGFGFWNAARMQVIVEDVGPLVITSPTGVGRVTQAAPYVLEWDVAATDTVASTLYVYFSYDEGASFPYYLGTVVNNGSAAVQVPCVSTGDATGRFKLLSDSLENSHWYALSQAFSIPGSSCTIIPTALPTRFPTIYPTPPTTSQPLFDFNVWPTLRPTVPPTFELTMKVEFTCRFTSFNYNAMVATSNGLTDFENSFRATVASAASVPESQTFIRHVGRIDLNLQLVSDGTLASAHVDFEAGQESLLSSFERKLLSSPGSIFSDANGWGTYQYGVPLISNVTSGNLTSPLEGCSAAHCYYVAWSVFDEDHVQKLEVEHLSQVIFSWVGDNSVLIVPRNAFESCDIEAGVKLTTPHDEENEFYTFSTGASLRTYYLISGEKNTFGPSKCELGLKTAVTVKPANSNSVDEQNATAQVFYFVVIAVIVLAVAVSALCAYCVCKRIRDNQENKRVAGIRLQSRISMGGRSSIDGRISMGGRSSMDGMRRSTLWRHRSSEIGPGQRGISSRPRSSLEYRGSIVEVDAADVKPHIRPAWGRGSV